MRRSRRDPKLDVPLDPVLKLLRRGGLAREKLIVPLFPQSPKDQHEQRIKTIPFVLLLMPSKVIPPLV